MTKYPSLFLLAVGSLAQAANAYNITASAGLMLDDNITRAQYDRDIYDDRAWTLGITGDIALPLTDRSRAQFTAALETRQYQDAELGNETLSLQADYIFQPASGYTAPWYSAYLLLGVISHDSDFREGNFNEIGFTLGKRLTDSNSLRVGVSRRSESADSDIFSLDTIKLFGNLDFKLGQHTAYTTLAFSTGDFVSTNTYPHPPSLDNVPWLHPDDDAAFPFLDNSWTYKLDADVWSLRAGYVHALSSNQSIDTSFLFYDAAAQGGNDYNGSIFNITYFYRF